MSYKIIDISEFQGAGVDFDQIKSSGVDGIMIRAGENYKGVPTKDSCWDRNISEAKARGFHVGPYYTCSPTSIESAYNEANFFLSLLAGHTFDMPCYVDLEENEPWLIDNVNDVIQVFYDVLENGGYTAGAYSYYNWYKNFIDLDRWINIPLWIAQNPKMTLDPKYFGMWQFGTTDIAGFKGPVDTNELYIPYWEKLTPQAEPEPIKVVPDPVPIQTMPEGGAKPMKDQLDVIYSVHSQNLGWGPDYKNGQTAGTVHQCLRMEAIKAMVVAGDKAIHLMERLHVQDYGWMDPVYDGAIGGTVGEFKEIEAVQFQLFGDDAAGYSIWYQVQVQNMGWLGWVRDGALTGTVGKALQAEAIRILVLDSSIDLTADTTDTFVQYVAPPEPAPAPEPAPVPVASVDMISDHFARSEYACDCNGRYCDGFPVQMNQDLINGIEGLRLALGVRVHISSGVRCPERNSEVGGIPNSKHTQGLAADVWIDGMSDDVVDLISDTAQNIGMRTIKYYDQQFVHCEL